MKVPESHKLKMILKSPHLGWARNYEWELYECNCKNHLMAYAYDGKGGCMLIGIINVPPRTE